MKPSAAFLSLLTGGLAYNPNTPNTVAGLLLWMDASDATTVAFDGGSTAAGPTVLSWTDKVSGIVFSQGPPASSNPPVLDTISQFPNGRKGMDFTRTGGNRYLHANTPVSIPTDSTVFFTTYWPNAGGNFRALALHKGTSTNAINTAAGVPFWAMMRSNVTSPNGYAAAQMDSTSTVKANTANGIVSDAASTVAFQMAANMANSALYLNGSAQTLTTTGTATSGSMSVDTVGSSDNTYTSYGSFGEILVYNSILNSTDRATIEAYLKAKWGTP